MRLFWRNLFRYNGTRGELGQIGLKAEKKWNELWTASGFEDPPILTDVSAASLVRWQEHYSCYQRSTVFFSDSC